MADWNGILKVIFEDRVGKFVIRAAISVFLIFLTINCVVHLWDWYHGRPSKVFWGMFETHMPPRVDTIRQTEWVRDTIYRDKIIYVPTSAPLKQDIKGKNVNTGTLNGNLGDTYNERIFTKEDQQDLLVKIGKFRNATPFEPKCVTIGLVSGNGGAYYNGLRDFLLESGYRINTIESVVTTETVKGLQIRLDMDSCMQFLVGSF